MPAPKKVEAVKELQEKLGKSNIVIAAEFQKVTVADMTALRRKLKAKGIELRVVKNTLAALAAEQAGKGKLGDLLKGPRLVVLGYGDIIEPVKLLSEQIKAAKLNMTIVGAVTDGKVMKPAEVQVLATLPSREVLLAQVVGGLQSPIAGLVYTLSSTIQGLATVLDGRIKQLEAQPQPAAS